MGLEDKFKLKTMTQLCIHQAIYCCWLTTTGRSLQKIMSQRALPPSLLLYPFQDFIDKAPVPATQIVQGGQVAINVGEGHQNTREENGVEEISRGMAPPRLHTIVTTSIPMTTTSITTIDYSPNQLTGKAA